MTSPYYSPRKPKIMSMEENKHKIIHKKLKKNKL